MPLYARVSFFDVRPMTLKNFSELVSPGTRFEAANDYGYAYTAGGKMTWKRESPEELKMIKIRSGDQIGDLDELTEPEITQPSPEVSLPVHESNEGNSEGPPST